MSRTPALFLISSLAVGASALAPRAVAQGPMPEPRQVHIERSYMGSYSESVSRELFQACDADSDDRLDVFETTDALETLRNPRNSAGYARIDSDRDGYVTWPEFDQLFRRGLRSGGVFRVRTCRPFIQPAAPPQPATPLQQFLQQHDTDRDKTLSTAEVEQLLQRMGLPESLAVLLRAGDLDGSGTIDETELAPWFQSLPPLVRPDAQPGASPLPQPWFEADADLDGAIDLAELQQVLRRLDPGLLRWAKELLARLDRDRDGKLGQSELIPPGELPATTEQPAAGQPTSDRTPLPPQR